MTERFRVSTTRSGRRRNVQIVVYDDVAELRRAASHYRGEPEGEFANACGISQPRCGAEVTDDGVTRFPGAGTIRLWKGQMGAAVVAHECFHMALSIYREDFDYQDIRYARDDEPAHLSLADMANEEVLCHIASDLVRSVNHKLWNLGVYA